MKQQPIYIFAEWQIQEGQLATVLSYLPDVAEKSTAEPGNLYYHIFQDNATPNRLVLSEGYKDEEALAAHRNSSHYQDIVVTKILPLLANRQVTLTHQLLTSANL